MNLVQTNKTKTQEFIDMNLSNFTIKAAEAIQVAQQQALKY